MKPRLEPGQTSLFEPPTERREYEPLPDPSRNTVGAFHGAASDAPETEREAAKLAFPRTGSDRLRVLVLLLDRGDRGATDEEIAEELGLRLYTAAPRRNELKRDGWVEASGDKRPTTTGTPATVWVVTARGRGQAMGAAA